MCKMSKRSFQLGVRATLFGGALCVVLIVYGAIPFYTVPTLGQALWCVGFSQSFINESVFNIYARNFGAPSPAAIAFGLSGAWPIGVLIKVGLNAVDAYTVMTAIWLSVAFLSAFKIGRYLSLSYGISVLAALAWGTMPVIWNHSAYSMLSLGFALFPFYMLLSFKLFSRRNGEILSCPYQFFISLFYLMVCLVSVFMDGYSFVMFAVAGTVLGFFSFIQNNYLRSWYLRFSIPVHLACFFAAYILYVKYIGIPEFEAESLDWVRAEGVDVMFLLVPTRGILWVMDILGISVLRPTSALFGNSAGWGTTFILPVVAGAVFSMCCMRRLTKYTLPFLFCLLFSIYMALGPSLKVNSKKNPDQSEQVGMPASSALCRTGSEFITQNIPGFRNMRFCYRWIALSAFCAWVLILLFPFSRGRGSNFGVRCVLVFLVIINLPYLPRKLSAGHSYRSIFFKIEHDWIGDMSKIVRSGETVAFLPWGNDFSINYIAAKLGIVTYNIGGDKNVSEARRYWPEVMQGFSEGVVDLGFSHRVIELLKKGEVDRVILPYADMHQVAYQWPCPLSFKGSVLSILGELRKCDSLKIMEREYYISIELASECEPQG